MRVRPLSKVNLQAVKGSDPLAGTGVELVGSVSAQRSLVWPSCAPSPTFRVERWSSVHALAAGAAASLPVCVTRLCLFDRIADHRVLEALGGALCRPLRERAGLRFAPRARGSRTQSGCVHLAPPRQGAAGRVLHVVRSAERHSAQSPLDLLTQASGARRPPRRLRANSGSAGRLTHPDRARPPRAVRADQSTNRNGREACLAAQPNPRSLAEGRYVLSERGGPNRSRASSRSRSPATII